VPRAYLLKQTPKGLAPVATSPRLAPSLFCHLQSQFKKCHYCYIKVAADRCCVRCRDCTGQRQQGSLLGYTSMTPKGAGCRMPLICTCVAAAPYELCFAGLASNFVLQALLVLLQHAGRV
jgi:hypothetical protein